MSVKIGKCENHQPPPWKSSIGKTPSERGYGYKWQKVRKKALIRDGYLCQECMKYKRTRMATEVDHILNKARGGTDDIHNLQSLCSACHEIKTIAER